MDKKEEMKEIIKEEEFKEIILRDEREDKK
jgi:hypothetical protein